MCCMAYDLGTASPLVLHSPFQHPGPRAELTQLGHEALQLRL